MTHHLSGRTNNLKGGEPMETAQAGEALWTKQEIAERLRISIPTLDREIAAGAITPIRIAKQRLVITESEVQRYLASR